MHFSSDRVIACFQPILSADTKEVYSYEVLGRYIDDEGTIQSLGPFFSDPHTSDEEALEIDRIVRRYAIQKYAQEKRTEYLFINIRLAWLVKHAHNPEELPTIKWAKEFGVDPDRLVIEITEEEINTHEAYYNVLMYYKNAGCRIALDDYGKNASNIDRLAVLLPDIIKIDMNHIHESVKSYHYREYLRSISSFAEAVGIEVLYEGVETQRQLDICVSLKGRYYQGFLIGVPQTSMSGMIFNRAVFSFAIENAYKAIQKKAMRTEALRGFLDSQVERFLFENPFDIDAVDIDAYLADFCHVLLDMRRVYLCNQYGDQLSSNIERHLGKIVYSDYKGKNWAWRGFFHEALAAFSLGRKSCLSRVYRDFTTKEKTSTYYYAISDTVFLFVDI